MKSPIKIFSGSDSKYLAEKIANSYGIELGKTSILRFSDGEIQPSYEETVRGATVFIVQSTYQQLDNLFELMLLIDAAKRASAYKIVAVIPYFGYARQDRKDKPRVAVGAKLVANLLIAAGVNRIMTMDLHADQIQGFFDIPVDHLFASSLFVPYIKSLNLKNIVIAAPDVGGTKRAQAYSKFLHCEMVICYKHRERPNHVGKIMVIGDVKGKDVILLDDMIDTAGTITAAADLMLEKGAHSVRAMATHAVFSGSAYEKLEKSAFVEVIVTDTIPLKKKIDKVTVLSVSNLFADVIGNVYNFESISSKFIQ
ncbi:MAG: ribose-phosphate pyrophosphokinase [Bacteroidetes bacterium RIFOXYA12_FULL_33_9]|nr:MAG: ribose-phosphate pyrophosphokinase [Bacteroidetes bacterium RIFOXYA12_FULL_33_9]